MNEFRQQIAAALHVLARNGDELGIATKAALLGGDIDRAKMPRTTSEWRNLATNFLVNVIFESLPHPHSEPIGLDEDDRLPLVFGLRSEPCKRTDPEAVSHHQAQACNQAAGSSEGAQCPQSKAETCANGPSKPPRVVRIFPFGISKTEGSPLCRQLQAATEILFCYGDVPFSTKVHFYGDKETARQVDHRLDVLTDAIAFWHQFQGFFHLLDGLPALELPQLRVGKYGFRGNPDLMEFLVND